MKLRNLLFGTMIACAFASCSNDDDPTIEPTPDGGGVAQIMVNPDLLRGNLTKASTKAAVDESVYNKYTVYVFNRATGVNLGHGAPGTAFEVKNNPGAVDVMVVGNVGEVLTGEENKSAVLAATKAFDDKEEAGETVKDGGSNSIETTSQSSHVYQFILQGGVINRVGYADAATEGSVNLTADKIQLYRHVAKIVLNKISVQGKAVGENGEELVYTNPKLDVKSVFILNAQNATKLAADTRWGTVFNPGKVMGSVSLQQFNDWKADAEKIKTDKVQPYIPTTATPDNSYVEHSAYSSAAAGIKGVIANDKIFTSDNKFYVYESTNVANGTLLVVEGDFSYDDPEDPVKRVSESGYYTVVLGAGDLTLSSLDTNLFPNAENNMGVRRNIQYNVNLIVKAPGSKNPIIPNTKVASLDSQIELVGYGQVSSDHTFE